MRTLAKLKISTNLFLGNAELDRLTLWWKQNNAILKAGNARPGIVRGYGVGGSGGFRITQGTTPDKVSIAAGRLVVWDSTEEEIRIVEIATGISDVASIPTDGTDYYVKLRWISDTLEEGTCQVSASGQLTGSGTMFTEIMRGQPGFPSKIAFSKSGLVNTGEYEVVNVASDTSVQLSGSFTLETGLKYKVVGTFTPDTIVSSGDKFVFEYNGYEVYVEASATVNNTTEVLLGKVSTDGVTMSVEDHRSQWYAELADSEFEAFSSSANNLIGVEWAKYDTIYSAKDVNIVKIGWGYRADNGNWSADLVQNRILITSGNGGIFEVGDTVTSGTMNGWRVYFGNSGKYVRVSTQTFSSGNVVLNLDRYSSAEFPASGVGSISVVPDCDKIAIRTTSKASPTDMCVEDDKVFPVHYGQGIMRIHAVGATIEYRQIWGRNTGVWRIINDGDYLDETSWNDDGTLNVASMSSVAGGEITLLLHPSNYGVAAVLNNQNNTLTGLLSQSIGATTHTAGVVQASTPEANYLGVFASPGDNISGIYTTPPAGTVMRLVFNADINLVHGANFILNPKGSNLALIAGQVATFVKTTSTAWRLTAVGSNSWISQAFLSLNAKSSTSDVMTLLVTNDSNTSKVFAVIGDISKAANGSLLYLPPSTGMLAKYDDPSGQEKEAWNTFAITSGNLTGATFVSLGAARYKIIGKTCHIMISQLAVTIGGSPAPFINVNNLSINGRTFSDYIGHGIGAMAGPQALRLNTSSESLTPGNGNSIFFLNLDGSNFSASTSYTVSGSITLELV